MFTIPEMTKELILPLSIQLYLKLFVQHKNKNIMPDNKGHVIPVNGIANSVFKNVEIKMNNIVVSNVNNMYEFRAGLENCLGLEIDVQKNPMGIERHFQKRTVLTTSLPMTSRSLSWVGLPLFTKEWTTT